MTANAISADKPHLTYPEYLTEPHRVETGSYLAQPTILRDPERPRQHKCRITDCSFSWYKAVILSPFPDAAERFELGQELQIEHVDGWQRTVQVRAASGNVLELQILNPVSRVILPNRATGVPHCHECDVLGTHGELFRVAFKNQPELFGTFKLELPTGEMLKVRVRWARDGEICLQPVAPYRRL
ncbi:hypothetical protein [Acidocella sp.]|uniref:hypothetical protein n=1 Tax=Acidocella sp. TaxID=50710 RepID=UPI0026150895|nr:hypothetical protein [Acidocella sp.]